MTQPKTRDEALGLLFREIKKIKPISYMQCILFNNIRENTKPDKIICGDICPFAEGDSCILKNIYLYYKQASAFTEPTYVNPEDLEIG